MKKSKEEWQAECNENLLSSQRVPREQRMIIAGLELYLEYARKELPAITGAAEYIDSIRALLTQERDRLGAMIGKKPTAK